jgi:two-component system response regulator
MEAVEGERVVLLLAEDNAAHAKLVLRSLREHNVANEVHHVADGEAALDYLLRRGAYSDPQRSPRPHVILLDLRMPKIDGLEVLGQIKANEDLRRIPVVILTTSDAEVDMARAYDLHVNSFLVKPIDFAKFARLMGDLGYYWLVWNRTLPPRNQNGSERSPVCHEVACG